jgi:hypothetical protein
VESLPLIAVLHIPRSSRNVPQKQRQAICLDGVHLNNELLRMTDADLCGSVRHLGLLVLALHDSVRADRRASGLAERA